jgi:hypothetical protein
MTGRSKGFSRIALAAALLLLTPVLGCETKPLTIEIPGYGDRGDVDGVWLWRLTEGTSQYQRMCRFELGAPARAKSGAEVVPYRQVCSSPDQIGMDLTAEISRLPANPSTIVVKLYYFRYANPGQFRASSYNSAGESPLSPTALML